MAIHNFDRPSTANGEIQKFTHKPQIFLDYVGILNNDLVCGFNKSNIHPKNIFHAAV